MKNLNDFSHLVAIIATIMKDLYGEFDRQEVINKFREEILNREELK